jgi:hypothetical protein
LLAELHRLYRLAGPPGLRKISEEIQAGDFNATLNKNLVSRILNGHTLPTALQLDTLARYFCQLSPHSGDPEAESLRLTDIWLRAQQAPLALLETVPAATSVDQALRIASATGSPSSLREICANADPHRVIEVLDALKDRGWPKFATSVIESLSETFDFTGIPHLTAEIGMNSRYSGVKEKVLSRFAAKRPASESVGLARLLIAAGRIEDFLTLTRGSFGHQDPPETAAFLIDLVDSGMAPWSLKDEWNGRRVPTTALAQVAEELAHHGRPELIEIAVLYWTPRFDFQAVQIALELEKAGLQSHADSTLRAALRRSGLLHAKDYLSSEAEKEDKRTFLHIMDRNGEPIDPEERRLAGNVDNYPFGITKDGETYNPRLLPPDW